MHGFPLLHFRCVLTCRPGEGAARPADTPTLEGECDIRPYRRQQLFGLAPLLFLQDSRRGNTSWGCPHKHHVGFGADSFKVKLVSLLAWHSLSAPAGTPSSRDFVKAERCDGCSVYWLFSSGKELCGGRLRYLGTMHCFRQLNHISFIVIIPAIVSHHPRTSKG